jgi:hypothetical protein
MMSISRSKAAMAAGVVVVAAIAAGVIYSGVKRANDPMRAPMPDAKAPLSAIEPALDRLPAEDRQLAIGYLLLQRDEIPSLLTGDMTFNAKTLGEAVAQERARTAQMQVLPDWPLMRALEDQALKPLRDAVPLSLVARTQTTMSTLFTSNTGAVIVASGGGPDEARTVMIYRITNPGKVAISHLTGYIQPQVASDTWAGLLTHNASACRIDLANLAPGASKRVICAQIDLNTIGDSTKTPDSRLLIDWRPDMVEYADGTKLAYDTNAVNNTLIWNRYTIDGDIRK